MNSSSAGTLICRTPSGICSPGGGAVPTTSAPGVSSCPFPLMPLPFLPRERRQPDTVHTLDLRHEPSELLDPGPRVYTQPGSAQEIKTAPRRPIVAVDPLHFRNGPLDVQ